MLQSRQWAFRCEFCGMGFSNAINLIHHQDKRHAEEVEAKLKRDKCPDCGIELKEPGGCPACA